MKPDVQLMIRLHAPHRWHQLWHQLLEHPAKLLHEILVLDAQVQKMKESRRYVLHLTSSL